MVNAVHDEYYAANNAQTVDLQAVTRYTAAPSVVIPMGTTTLVPVTAVSARGTRPALSVTEIDDATDGPNIGILNFRQSTAAGGSVSGVLSITPSRPGTGVIHLYDADTESRVAVAFTVTEAAEGIDIFNDNGAFTFYNADGTPYDAEAVGNQSWAFNSAPGWGTGGSAEIPLRSTCPSRAGRILHLPYRGRVHRPLFPGLDRGEQPRTIPTIRATPVPTPPADRRPRRSRSARTTTTRRIP